MKKIFLLAFIIFFLLVKNATAQVDTSTVQKLLQYIMQPLDKNQIPTGFLEEYGSPMLPIATFNGTLTDSNRIVADNSILDKRKPKYSSMDRSHPNNATK